MSSSKKFWCYTIWWDLFKETIQRLRKKEKIIKRDNRQDMNSRPLDHKACALLLCYNHFFIVVKLGKNIDLFGEKTSI